MGWYVPVSMVCYTISVHPSSDGSIVNTSLNLATILCNSLPSISVKASSRSPQGTTILETFLNKYCSCKLVIDSWGVNSYVTKYVESTTSKIVNINSGTFELTFSFLQNSLHRFLWIFEYWSTVSLVPCFHCWNKLECTTCILTGVNLSLSCNFNIS